MTNAAEILTMNNSETVLDRFFQEFYADKRQIPEDADKAVILASFKKNLRTNMKRFVHEYDMGCLEYNDKFHIKAELSPEFQQYIIAVSQFLCSRSRGLKPAYTIQGKNAEGIVMFAVNNLLNFFRIRTRVKFNNKSFKYGGDGGWDFALGKFRFDVKHRDDGPNSGLILRESYIDRAEEDVILIFTTNAANIKLGSGLNKKTHDLKFDEVAEHLKGQVFPLAIVGWMSMKEFKEKMTERPGPRDERDRSFVVDNLHDITSLFMMIAEDQIDSEALFV